MTDTLSKALRDLGDRAENSEIAFFGGSFTAIDREYMLELLNAAKPFVSSFAGIRISTRPDYIDNWVLSLLKEYGVTSVELGAQSMDNSVLELKGRHDPAIIHRARVVVDSVTALAIADLLAQRYGTDWLA